MKKTNNLFFIVALCFFLISCGRKEHTELRPEMADYVYSVTYKKETIVINKRGQNNGNVDLLTLYFTDGEYYIKDGNKEETLFLSTKTVIESKINTHDYKIHIKRGDQDAEYCTTVFLKKKNDADSVRCENYRGACVPKETEEYLVTYYYDAEYHIKRIHEANTISFQESEGRGIGGTVPAILIK